MSSFNIIDATVGDNTIVLRHRPDAERALGDVTVIRLDAVVAMSLAAPQRNTVATESRGDERVPLTKQALNIYTTGGLMFGAYHLFPVDQEASPVLAHVLAQWLTRAT